MHEDSGLWRTAHITADRSTIVTWLVRVNDGEIIANTAGVAHKIGMEACATWQGHSNISRTCLERIDASRADGATHGYAPAICHQLRATCERVCCRLQRT